MNLKGLIGKLISTKVLENYSMMTLANVLGVVIGFVVYPYAIRVLGKDNYGSYVFAMAVIGFAQIVVGYGFATPCAKMVVERRDDRSALSDVVSCVMTAKMLMLVAVAVLLIALTSLLGDALGGLELLMWGLLNVVGDVLFPTWYFQGMKRMKVVTLINVGVRLLSLPAVFLLVRETGDTVVFMAVNSLFAALSGVVSVVWLRRVESIRLRLRPLRELTPYFRTSTQFFFADLAMNVKDYTMDLLVGKVFGMADLALYDLAHKIVRVPRMLTQNINGALFPELVDKATPERVRRARGYETLIGLGMMCAVALAGWPAVLLLGGESMTGAYPIAVCLSGTIPTWLVIGCYLNFVFVARGRYALVSAEQVVALVSGLVFFVVGVWAWGDILVAPCSMVFSTLCEIAFCVYASKKYRLL